MPLSVLVCVKSVADAASFPMAAAAAFPAAPGVAFRVNDYDLFALEEAARLREAAGARVTVVSAGPPRVEEQVRKAMGMGADEGFRVELAEDDDGDGLRVAAALAGFARARSFDLILCGVMSEDRMRQAVGPMLAELLGLPSATAAMKLEVLERTVRVERELSGEEREILELPLPALVTTQSGINLPRYPSLSNVLRVKKLAVPVVAPGGLPPAGPRPSWQQPERGRGEILSGTPAQVAAGLVERIRRSAPVL